MPRGGFIIDDLDGFRGGCAWLVGDVLAARDDTESMNSGTKQEKEHEHTDLCLHRWKRKEEGIKKYRCLHGWQPVACASAFLDCVPVICLPSMTQVG